jgi:Protein of unknown function (DUF2934)
MAEETVKKAKAPAKPKKATKKTETAVEGIKVVPAPSPEEIAALARKYWAERGWQDGYAEQDWLRAEHELRGKAS